jgi:hypothetical protein
MSTPDPDAKPRPPAKSTREARLAQALRDNLRRRKAAPPGAATDAESPAAKD